MDTVIFVFIGFKFPVKETLSLMKSVSSTAMSIALLIMKTVILVNILICSIFTVAFFFFSALTYDQLLKPSLWLLISVSLEKVFNFIRLQVLKYLTIQLPCKYDYFIDVLTNFRYVFQNFNDFLP